jgi:spore germination protein (amino acid permease)
MIKTKGNEITTMQFICLISGLQVSLPVLSIPSNLSETAGTDGWISILIGWAISLIVSLAIIGIMKKRPQDTLFDLASHYMGKWVGRTLALLFMLYFLCLAVDTLTRSVLITKIWLLGNTPIYLLMALILVPTYLVACNGPRIVGRYSELMTLMSLWIPFVYLFTLKEANVLHLFPILKHGVVPVLQAVKDTIYPTLGITAAFVFYPYLKHKEKATMGILLANTLTTAAYMFFTLICYLYFSPDEINKYNEPTISILKSIEFKFIERIEVPFISYYLLVFSLSWIPFLYLATFCSRWLLNKPDNRSHLRIVCAAIVVGIYFFRPTFGWSNSFEAWIGKIGFWLEYAFPVCLFLVLALYTKWKGRLVQ